MSVLVRKIFFNVSYVFSFSPVMTIYFITCLILIFIGSMTLLFFFPEILNSNYTMLYCLFSPVIYFLPLEILVLLSLF